MCTSPRGTVRMSIGPLNEDAHVDVAIEAVNGIAAGVKQ